MKGGPHPLPRNMRVVVGIRDRKTKNSPSKPVEEPPVRIPLPPDHLSPQEMEIFSNTARKLAAMRVMTEMDVDALVIYAHNWAEVLNAQEKIRASGQFVTVEGSQGQKKFVKNPFYIVRQQAEAVCTRLMQEFGLTPSSRNRVSQ